MKVLVCGGRDFKHAGLLRKCLAQIAPRLVIYGGCPTGADRMAFEWAESHHVNSWGFPADWDTYGRSAGPIRNQKMLEQSRPDVVLAFPGGRGTADMVRRAKAAGVPVIEVKP